MMKQADSKVPWFMILILLFCWLLICIVALFKGGHGVQSIVGVLPCSAAFWVLFVLPFPFIIILMIIFSVYIYRKNKKRKDLNYVVKGDIDWTLTNIFLFPFFFTCWFFCKFIRNWFRNVKSSNVS